MNNLKKQIICLLALFLSSVCYAANTVDPLPSARNARAQIVDIIVGSKKRTPTVISNIQALEARWSLTAIDETTFGFLALPNGDNMVAITSGSATLTSIGAPWTSADVGKTIHIQGAGVAGATLATTISGFTSAGSITLAASASTTVTPSKTSASGIAVWGYNPSTVLETSPLLSSDGSLAYQRDVGTLTGVIATGSTLNRNFSDRFAEKINVKDFGALGDGSTNDTVAIQSAINAGVAGGKTVYFPAGVYVVTSTITINGLFGIVGDSPATSIIRTVDINAPCFDITVNGSTIDSAFLENMQFQAYYSGVGVPGSNSSAIRISGDATSYFQWGRFSNLVIRGFTQSFDITKLTRTTAFGQECNVAWTTFKNITIRNFSRETQVGFKHRLGSGTGNTWTDIKASVDATNGIVWSFEGSGCVVGDIIISNSHLGGAGAGARGVYIGDNTVYRQRITLTGNQWDANLDVPLLVSNTSSIKLTNLAVNGNNHGGNSSIYSGLQANVSEMTIDDQEAGYWRAGKRVTTSATGSLSLDTFQIDIDNFEGCEVKIVGHGFVQGVAGGAVVKRYLLRQDGTTTSLTAIDSTRNPNVAGFIDYTTTTSANSVKFTLTMNPTGPGTDVASQIVVIGGKIKIKRF